jgi:NTE family protein
LHADDADFTDKHRYYLFDMFALFFIFFFFFSFTGHAQMVLDSHICQLGVTFSGGAARGYAHIGVIRAFEEAGVKIDYISGSSMGAIIGLFYAAGKTPDEMMDIAKSIKKRRVTSSGRFSFRKKGLDYMEQVIKKHIPEKTFDQLEKPLYVCVTNFQSGQYEIIAQGEIMPAIRATAAIPIMYRQQIINGVAYVDGGVVNNLPVEPLRERCRIVVGISVNPIEHKSGKMKLRKQIMRVAELMINENEARRIEMCDYRLEVPGLGSVDFEEYDHPQKIHDMGYRAAKEFLLQLRIKNLERQSPRRRQLKEGQDVE